LTGFALPSFALPSFALAGFVLPSFALPEPACTTLALDFTFGADLGAILRAFAGGLARGLLRSAGREVVRLAAGRELRERAVEAERAMGRSAS